MRVGLSGLSVKPGSTGGGETVLRHLVKHLPSTRLDLELVVYVSRANRGCFEAVAGDRVRLHVAGPDLARPAMRVAYEALALPGLLRRHGVDVFLGVNQALPVALPCPGVSLLQNELYYRFREFCRPRVVGWRQSLRMHLRFAYYGAANDRSLRRARRSAAVSHALRDLAVARSRVSPDLIDVVPLAPSEELTGVAGQERQDDGEAGGDPAFLVLGAITPYKNIERAIDAVAMLNRRGLPVRLSVVGWDVWGYARRLRAYADSQGIGDLVTFVGPVRHEETGEHYRRARALLMLSSCEAFPLPVVEAMRCGTPVIGSNLSGVPEAVGTGGVLVDPEDTRALSREMEAVAGSDERRSELAAAGAAWVSRFSWERTAAGLVETLSRGLCS